MHGAGSNRSNLPRISLDLRFMKKKDLKINNKSNATNKRYFFNFIIKMREFLKIINFLSRFRANS